MENDGILDSWCGPFMPVSLQIPHRAAIRAYILIKINGTQTIISITNTEICASKGLSIETTSNLGPAQHSTQEGSSIQAALFQRKGLSIGIGRDTGTPPGLTMMCILEHVSK